MSPLNAHIPSSVLARKRAELSPLAQKLLTRIWDYHVEKNLWIDAGELFRLEPDPAAETELDKLGPSIVFKDKTCWAVRYRIKFPGILLAKNGPEDAGLLVRFLDYLLKRYKDEKSLSEVANLEVQRDLNLTEQEAFRVSRLASIGGFCHQSNNWPDWKSWRLSPPSGLHQLQYEKDLLSVVEARAIECLSEADTSSEEEKAGCF
jgi:hypothetical protein